MKRIILLSCFAWAWNLVHAQTDSLSETKTPLIKRWEIGIGISPAYSNRTLNPEDEKSRPMADSIDLIESGKLSLTFGVTAKYSFNKRMHVKTGVFCSDKGVKSKGFTYFYYGEHIQLSEKTIRSEFYFVEIPVQVGYDLYPDGDYKLSIYMGPSVSLNANRHEYESRRTLFYYPSLPSDSEMVAYYVRPFGLMHLGAIASIKFTRRINEVFLFSFEPEFKFYPFTLYSSSFMSEINGWYVRNQKIHLLQIYDRPYSIGGNFTITYNF